MQLAHVTIENFRQFEHLEVDFTDALGRVREVSVMVGPNGSGKTTLLDAIAGALSAATGLPGTKGRSSLTPGSVVRKGALNATVTCRLRFSVEEVSTAAQVAAKQNRPLPDPNLTEATVTWTYPDPEAQHDAGAVRYEPEGALALLAARFRIAQLVGIASSGINLAWMKRAGRVAMIDQWRTALGKSVRQDISRIVAGKYEPIDAQGEDRWMSDPRQILIDLGIKAQIPGPGDDLFALVRDTYAKICAPRRILGVVREENDAFDVRFSDGSNEYGYDGVSSGEAMVLLFLIRLVSERIHRSIVLVDEIELHQHPVWQRRLLHYLPQMGESNQIIATTHSDYLRDVLPRGAAQNLVTPSKVVPLGLTAEHG